MIGRVLCRLFGHRTVPFGPKYGLVLKCGALALPADPKKERSR